MNSEPIVEWHCPECKNTFGEYVQEFISLFGTDKKLTKPLSDISGRILRGVNEEDFLTLTDNPNRHIVFLLDAIALSDLVGLDGRGILKKIGYNQDFITDLLARRTKFKLIVLPELTGKLATWDNLLDYAQEIYPDWRKKIEIARSILKNHNYETIMAMEDVATEVRNFLQNTINVNRLFAGDGYIRSEESMDEYTYSEYLTVNKRLSAFEAYALINFPVKVE